MAHLAKNAAHFKTVLRSLIDISWNSHEGAAMLVGYHTHCSKSPTARKLESINGRGSEDYDATDAMKVQSDLEREYLSNYHQKYEAPFRMFSFLRNTMLPPKMYEASTSVFANAVAQFAQNTDILPALSDFLAGEGKLTADYLNAEENHPDRRLDKLLQIVVADRKSAYSTLGLMFSRKASLLSEHNITLDDHNSFEFERSDRAKVTFVYDWLNNIFLEWACEVTSLPVTALHAREIASQFDDLLVRHAALFQRLGLPDGRFNISTHPDRFDFKPFIREIPGA
jgi:hypothetical protein